MFIGPIVFRQIRKLHIDSRGIQSVTQNLLSKHDKSELPIHVYRPDRENLENPAVIVLQEWWGLNDQVREQAKYLATQGYLACIPDLYRGKVADDVKEANHLMEGLDWGKAIADVETCVQHLDGTPVVKEAGITPKGKKKETEWKMQVPEVPLESSAPRKVVTLGFCMGGALSLLSAFKIKNLSGAIAFYGIPGKDNINSSIKIPLQLHFAELDGSKGFSDPQTAQAFENSLKKNKIAFESYWYRGGHGFMNDSEWYAKKRIELGITEPYNKNLSQLAWSRVLSFLDSVSKQKK